MNDDHADIVDVHFRPFVRALGNLVVVFALAERALLDLAAALELADEFRGRDVLKDQKAQQHILDLISQSKLEASLREELYATVSHFFKIKKERNRLIHDEWLATFDEDLGIGVATRGLLKKGSDVVWGEPDIETIWSLGLDFKECRSRFWNAERALRDISGV